MKWIVVLFLAASLKLAAAQFQWQIRDSFDEVKNQIHNVDEENCNIRHVRDLFLDEDTVSHKPDIKDININPVLPNRTAMLNVHNTALNRGFFFSYILQKAYDDHEPGLMYYYLSVIADVTANPSVNASALYFSVNTSYSPSYKGFFNKTMPLADDYNDPIHLERLATLNVIEAWDLGAIPPTSRSLNYTTDDYRINEWYRAWLPDNVKGRQDTKTTYQVKIRYANNTNETFTWHGPPGPDETPGPVKWTRPYFDCGRSNKWIFGASVPVADIYPRHTQFRHIEFPTYVGVSVVEMDFDRIDINQCPLGEGNPGPNKFAGTDHCKDVTTECEPLHGYGFRRGGYQCRCKPGYRLPNVIRQPYLGEIMERATVDEYHRGFSCVPIGFIMALPVDWYRLAPVQRQQYINQFSVNPENYKESSNMHYFINRTIDLNDSISKMDYVAQLFNFMKSVRSGNCKDRSKFSADDLVLRGDVSWGAEKQFANEARMALRLANFISAFLQIVDPTEVFAEFRLADKPLTEDQIMGEVLSLLLGDTRIWGAGVYWDRDTFPNKTLFAPYAYKTQLNTRKFNIDDMARLNSTKEVYTNKKWFKDLKARWATNLESLEEFFVKIHIRSNSSGQYVRKYERYPMSFRAPKLEHGWWSTPFFDCDGFHQQWVVMYAAPFFGWDSLRNKLKFMGAVTVAMDIWQMDIDQCPDNYWVPNVFKDSHKCDRKTSYCVPILGRGFDTGSYKCECLQGFEYPYENLITYYDGQLVESEYENIVKDKPSRYDTLKCRLAGASTIGLNWLLLPLLLTLLLQP